MQQVSNRHFERPLLSLERKRQAFGDSGGGIHWPPPQGCLIERALCALHTSKSTHIWTPELRRPPLFCAPPMARRSPSRYQPVQIHPRHWRRQSGSTEGRPRQVGNRILIAKSAQQTLGNKRLILWLPRPQATLIVAQRGHPALIQISD